MLAHVPVEKLDKRVTISTPALTADGDGGVATSWTALSTVFAGILAMSQAERQGANTVSAASTHVVTIRYLAGVTTKCKVVFGSRTFGIDGIENIGEQNAYLRLSCTEKVA